ncbi:MAG: transcriptional regulator [Deltaproteobacteria bacterium]|nr:transcriptional regulator [Deltaproteobacteria bacterium]
MDKTATKTTKEPERIVESVTKALKILDCFTASESQLSLKLLNEKTGLYKSGILRLCGTLVAQGYLVRMPASTYRLGPKLLILGNVYEKSNPLAPVARPILRELSLQTGESSALYIIEGLKRLCLIEQEGFLPIRYVMTEGKTQELYAGAGGKVLLAYAPEELRDQILSNLTLRKITNSTIVNRRQLEKEFKAIRECGFAISLGERIPELAAMAVPVFDAFQKACAALSIGGLIQRFTADRCRKYLKPLKGSAHELSLLLGYTGGRL